MYVPVNDWCCGFLDSEVWYGDILQHTVGAVVAVVAAGGVLEQYCTGSKNVHKACA